ncbi:VOC family protein [Bradyrhizobium elkanii]|uniref:VOC family protein n=1 Tax=Bradyrhizobium elkanii TaxID=29448 RepID=UPI000841B345|nr:VOC family protein [Bradyrhizobium elkanii]ODM72975.1 glyoxalase [Bradyrhizobium elkanii]ODM76998.1 glyoxalase [Bradyrhizobium elkanii]
MSTESRKPAIDMKLEVVVIPVSDVDRAKRFYEDLGWRLDADFVRADGSRALQLTPPGSPTSIHLDKGSALPRFLIVNDIEAARADLIARGVDVSEVFHRGAAGRITGPDPERPSYGSLATFNDPDGNVWLLQQVTQRLPGRVDGNNTTFAPSADLAAALRRAAEAHGEHEKRTGSHDANWPDWYADYIVREQAGKSPPE